MFTDNYRLVRLGMAEAHRAAEQERSYRRRDADVEPYASVGVEAQARIQTRATPAPVLAPAALPASAELLDTTPECGPCETGHQAA